MESYRGNRVVGLSARCLGGMSILMLAAKGSRLKEGKTRGGIATGKDTGDLQQTGRIFVGRVGMSAVQKLLHRPKKIRGKRGRRIGVLAYRQEDLIPMARRARRRRARGISAKKGEPGIASPKGWRKRPPAGSRRGIRGPRRGAIRRLWDLTLPRLGEKHRKKGN